MHSFDATFHRLLVKAIEEEAERQRSIITDKALPTHDVYCLHVGRLDGLRLALQLAQSVEQRLQAAA